MGRRADGWLHARRKADRQVGKREAGSGKTKTAAKNALRDIVRDYEDGVAIAPHDYTVAKAVTDWLTYGLHGRDEETVKKLTYLAEGHVIPGLGARKLRQLLADDVDRWLAERAEHLSTRTLREVRSVLLRAISRAQARDKVKRNVVLLCEVPTGRVGRPSKALTLAEAETVLKAAEADESTIGTYIVVSLLSGARTEEVRPLTWSHVDLVGDLDGNPPVPPHMMVWRSVRAGSDTKTRKSRRTLALPARCVDVLRAHRVRQERWRATQLQATSGRGWTDHDLVFATETGTMFDATNVRRKFRHVAKAAGLVPEDWTPRELRHSFVSLLSDGGVPIEQIALLVGHSGTSVTEQVYRHQIRPVMQDGAGTIDRLFPGSAR